MEGDVFKEEIIKTVIIWRKTLGSHYRCFFPSLARYSFLFFPFLFVFFTVFCFLFLINKNVPFFSNSQIENFLDSLGPNLSHLLVLIFFLF